MRILVTTPTFPPEVSGLANASYTFMRLLESLGYEVIVATSFSKDRTYSANIHQFNVEGRLHLRNGIRGETSSYLDWIVKNDFDLIFCQAWHCWSTELILLNKVRINKPIVLLSHGTSAMTFYDGMLLYSVFRFMGYIPYFIYSRKLASSVDALVALSSRGEASRFRDVSRFIRKNKPVYFLPNTFTKAGHEGALGLVSEHIRLPSSYVLSVGSFSREKGHDRVLLAYVKSPYLNKVPLVLCGQRKTSFMRSLLRRAKMFGVYESMIVFVHGVSGSDLFRLYDNCLFFANGSRTECQPLVILDSHAANKPFVSFNVGDLEQRRSGLVAKTQTEFNYMFSFLCSQQAQENLSLYCKQDLAYHSDEISASVIGSIIRSFT